ncbi:hypothetical protein C8F01DRAFT_1149430 [Mycena amicta]|nr:hypothetical protein C8F01DRAFT_1149430 [Mycena amicta]
MSETGLTFYTGPILIGTQLNWCLLGVLAVQVYFFRLAFPDEMWGIKALVYTLFAIDLIQTGFGSAFAYQTLVTNWGNPGVFVTLPWTGVALPFTSGLISIIVQHFFAWRIYRLKGQSVLIRIICVLIIIVSLMQGLSAMVNSIRFAIASQLTELRALLIGTKIWLSGAAVCDVIIALTMIVILAEKRRSVPWKKTDSLITKLIFHSVETGAVTTVAAAVELGLFISHPENFMHEVPVYILGKLYSNVVLATLNARWRSERHIFTDQTAYTNPSTSLQLKSVGGTSSNLRFMPGERSKTITVDTVTEVHGASQIDLERKRSASDF